MFHQLEGVLEMKNLLLRVVNKINSKADKVLNQVSHSHFILGPAFKTNQYNTLFDEFRINNLAQEHMKSRF